MCFSQRLKKRRKNTNAWGACEAVEGMKKALTVGKKFDNETGNMTLGSPLCSNQKTLLFGLKYGAIRGKSLTNRETRH
jgi:hypothetical protein